MDDQSFEEYSTKVGEWICEKTSLAFKYLMISIICGIGGAIGFFIVYISFLKFGGLQWLFNFAKSVVIM